MDSLTQRFKGNAADLKNTRVLVGVALFCALAAVLNMVKINISADLRISFTFLAVAASCYFYGPWPNVIGAFLLDFLSFLTSPTGFYFPGFAITAMLQALIYAAFFYKEKVSWSRVILARGLAVFLGNIILNSLWLKIMYSSPFWAMFVPRLIKNLILFPVEVLALYSVLLICSRMKKRLPSH